ncbi:MAG: Gfo/Idh/MocA family oxidoreductase, partial [Gammaproteobacteria bacterium]|nr:Gfo/Idh/MocA family oxidoreductase [Gammaproteobacteria bacterium]
MKRLRMGAISFDHGHQYGWCGAHLQLPMVELVAVSEWIPEQVERVKSTLVSSDGAMRTLDDPEQGPVEFYEDYHDLLARDDIDAVSISSANAYHLEHTEAAAKAGKHV